MNASFAWQPVLWRALAIWLPVAVAVTGLAALVYGAVQQDMRQSANDPQVQLAEDAATQLDAGALPSSVVPSMTVDIGRSLAPFVMVFDATGSPVASSAQLHGRQPPFPTSVFDAAHEGQDRVTWQPEPGVRSAVVVESWHGGFVVAGRSLRLVEERADHILQLTIFMWLLTLCSTVAAALLAGGILAARSGEIPWRGSRLARMGFLATHSPTPRQKRRPRTTGEV
jgi:hypothetical protein